MATERRYGEPFTCAPGMRLDSHEKLAAMQVAQINAQLARIETMMERLDRRIWLTVYGVVAVMLSQAAQQILNVTP